MRSGGTDALGVLRWGLRRYAAIFLGCLFVGAVLAPVLVMQQRVPADATALVIASRLDMNLIALPRYGEAVFDSGEVARAVSAALPDLGDPEGIIPEHVSLVAEQNSIIFAVVGHDPVPERAAQIADVAATAFVNALNLPGAGVGDFQVQNSAQTPAEPGKALGLAISVPVGIVAGAILGLAVVGALLVVRRPVIDGYDATEATGVAALGIVKVPRTRGAREAPPEEFTGLVPVCRRLLDLPTPTILLVSRRRDEGIRHKLARALVGVLGRVGEIRFLTTSRSPGSATGAVVGVRPADRGDAPVRATVIDSSETLDLVQPSGPTTTVLVAPVGIGESALRTAVVEHLGGSAEARLVLVTRGRRNRMAPSPQRSPGPSPHQSVAVAGRR